MQKYILFRIHLAWVYELPENSGIRYIIVQTLSKKVKYSSLVSNISKSEMSSVDLFHFYNKRQAIEAFFKMSKDVYNIKDFVKRTAEGIKVNLPTKF